LSNNPIEEKGLLTSSDDEWEKARLRHSVISSLAKEEYVNWVLADEAALKLGISRRQVYNLLKRFRNGNDLITDMLLNKSYGGKGKGRLPIATEQVIQGVLQSLYLNKQKYNETVIWGSRRKPQKFTVKFRPC